MPSRKKQLTQAVAEAAKPNEIVRDTLIPGFHLKVTPVGKKSWMYQFRLKDGAARNPCLGHFPQMSAAEARKKAGDFQNMRNNGVDPTKQFRELRASPTLREVFMPATPWDGRLSYKESSLDRRAGAKSQAIYASMWRCHVEPALGGRRVSDISADDILRVYAALKLRGKTQAFNFCVVMQPFFDWCEAKGLRPKNSNPVRAVRAANEIAPAPHMVRRHPLTDAQFVRINEELTRYQEERPEDMRVRAIRILMMTGLRRSEITSVEREWIDLANGVLHLPRTKSGRVASGDPGRRSVHLSPRVVEIIREIYAMRPDSKWLIPGPAGQMERHRRDGQLYQRGGDFPDLHLHNTWRAVRARAGVPNLNLHGLRHFFVVRQSAAGVKLADISRMLGHKNMAITLKVYADVFGELHGSAVTQAQDFMADLMERKPAEVVTLPRKTA